MARSSSTTADLQIRPAIVNDADALATLATVVFRQTYGTALPSAIMEPYLARTFASSVIREAVSTGATTYLVATLDQQVVGYSKCAVTMPPPCVTEPKAIELVNLYVHPAHHGRGVGRALLHQTLQVITRQKFTTMWLCAWQENQTALRFYQRAGFTTVGQTEIVVDGVIFVDWVMQKM